MMSAGHGIPEAEPHERTTGPEREIGPMRDVVEHPVADDGRSHERKRARPGPHARRDESCNHTPRHAHQQAVAPWVTDEVERRERGDARHNAHRLESAHEKQRPQHIETKRGDEPGRQRHARLRLLCAKRNGKVSNEHGRRLRQIT
jgi:hypothetical protein